MIKIYPFKNESDYHSMQKLIVKNQGHPDISPYPSLGDLDFRRFLENDEQAIKNVHLWKDSNGNLIGFLWPDNTDPLMVCDYEFSTCEKEMLAWAEQRSINHLGDESPIYQYMDCYDKNQNRINMLTQLGYKKTNYYCYYGKLNLDEFNPTHQLNNKNPNDRYHIRTLKTGDVKQRSELHKIAAGKSINQERYFNLIKRAPSYNGELDLICVDSDNMIAAFCTLWFDSNNKSGLLEPYGTHPDHRRKKLMSSLLSHGFEKIRNLGSKTVYVAHGGCDSDELDPALKLNSKMGFKEIGRDYFWKKELKK